MGGRLQGHKLSRGAGAVAIIAIVAVVGVIGFIGWVVVGSQQPESTLVPIDSPETVKVDDQQNAPADGLPAGFTAYTNPTLGFSFAYPSSWGSLQPTGQPGAVNLATPKLAAYSMSGPLEVYADPTDKFRLVTDDQGITITPRLNNSTYEWVVVDRGASQRAQVGKLYTQPPAIAHRSGKAVVYSILRSKGTCTTHDWLVPANGHFFRVRIPEFCLSTKTADADVQAGHKSDYDRQRQQVLESITVL